LVTSSSGGKGCTFAAVVTRMGSGLSIVALVDESQQNGHGVLTSAIAPTVRKPFDRLRPRCLSRWIL